MNVFTGKRENMTLVTMRVITRTQKKKSLRRNNDHLVGEYFKNTSHKKITKIEV